MGVQSVLPAFSGKPEAFRLQFPSRNIAKENTQGSKWSWSPDESHHGGRLPAARHAAYQAEILRHHAPATTSTYGIVPTHVGTTLTGTYWYRYF